MIVLILLSIIRGVHVMEVSVWGGLTVTIWRKHHQLSHSNKDVYLLYG